MPFGSKVTAQPPVPSQTDVAWHAVAMHMYAVPPHAPFRHTSALVQPAPSLHAVPLEAFGLEHCPLDGLQVPATWHWSGAAQTTELPPLQAPPSHRSLSVQASPSLHGVSSVTADQALVEDAGVQTSHAFAGSAVPAT